MITAHRGPKISMRYVLTFLNFSTIKFGAVLSYVELTQEDSEKTKLNLTLLRLILIPHTYMFLLKRHLNTRRNGDKRWPQETTGYHKIPHEPQGTPRYHSVPQRPQGTTRHHKGPRWTTEYYKTPKGTLQGSKDTIVYQIHWRTPQCTTRPTGYYKASQGTTRHHTVLQGIKRCRKASQGTTGHHKVPQDIPG